MIFFLAKGQNEIIFGKKYMKMLNSIDLKKNEIFEEKFEFSSSNLNNSKNVIY